MREERGEDFQQSLCVLRQLEPPEQAVVAEGTALQLRGSSRGPKSPWTLDLLELSLS